MAKVPGPNNEDHGSSREELVDEFTVPGNQRELLQESQAQVQTLFPVQFTILGSLESFCHDQKGKQKVPEWIWVQLKGEREAVQNAKEYIKGLSDPEMATTEAYPKEMHCIFVGAGNFFLHSLIRDTCANIQVLEIGLLSIRGGTEAVVMAQSKVQQFVKIFRDGGSLTSKREPEVKRKFKVFVEAHADKYTMDLLLLPSALKEELLTLIGSDHYLVSQDDTDLEIATVNLQANNPYPCSQGNARTKTPVTELMCQLDSVFAGVSQPSTSSSGATGKRRGPEKENECRKKPFSLQSIESDGPALHTPETADISLIDLTADDAEDTEILEDDQEPVNSEAEYRILVNFFKTMGYPQVVVEKVISEFGQTEEPMILLDEIARRCPRQHVDGAENNLHRNNQSLPKPSPGPTQEVTIEPIVIPESPTEGLLRTTHFSEIRQEESIADKLHMERTKNISFVARGTTSAPRSEQALDANAPGPSKQPPARIERQVAVQHNNTAVAFIPLKIDPKHAAHGRQARPEPSVTGAQIFLNSIKTPYKLELKNEPGKEDLRHIIIDGSNVAMSHGLQRFFSCRGIAIAVDSFWNKGHRKITVFVPQWRTKRDPYIKEQHFLQQLEELGILSFTPARTVMGAHIAAHDDRFLLHLAEKTNGIIVTNDNLREFVGESMAWMWIIKERILQYTFVGDIFMLPDDPLGRNGPKLDDFLRSCLEKRNTSLTLPTDSGVFLHSCDQPMVRVAAQQMPPNALPPRQINPAIHPRQINPTIVPWQIIPAVPPRQANPAVPPRQTNPAVPPRQTNPAVPPRQANTTQPPRQGNPAVPSRQISPAVPPRQINPEIMNMPCPRAGLPAQRNFYETMNLKTELTKIFPEMQQRDKINAVLNAHPYMRDLNALSAMILD